MVCKKNVVAHDSAWNMCLSITVNRDKWKITSEKDAKRIVLVEIICIFRNLL